MNKRSNSGFTLLETLAMLVCLFVVVWLSFALWRKSNKVEKDLLSQPPIEAKQEEKPLVPATPTPTPLPASASDAPVSPATEAAPDNVAK